VRVECESCRELVAASFAIAGGAVRATCPACAHAMTVPVAPALEAASGAAIDAASGAAIDAASGAAIDAAPGAAIDAASGAAIDAAPGAEIAPPGCPRCGASLRGGAFACAACGLAADRRAAYVDARDAAIPEPLREAWERATRAWSDPASHDEVLRLVAVHSCYAWAAARYRTRRGDPLAARQLDRLRRAAEATLLASATARPDPAARPYRATAGVLAILVVAILVGLIYARAARTPTGSPSAAVPARPLVPGHPVTSSRPGGP
jgi:hypothetical protein